MASPASPSSPCDDLSSRLYRLPRHVVPTRYDLRFEPDTGREQFEGHARIVFRVVEPLPQPTDTLVLHSLELKFAAEHVTVHVIGSDETDIPNEAPVPPSMRQSKSSAARSMATAMMVPTVACDLKCKAVVSHDMSETVELVLEGALPNTVGSGFVVTVSPFMGTINGSRTSQGMYFSNSEDPAFVATHLEPANARRLFPCYDETCFQSVYQLTVIASTGLIVVSNTPLLRDEPADGEDVVASTTTATATTVATSSSGSPFPQQQRIETSSPTTGTSPRLNRWTYRPGQRGSVTTATTTGGGANSPHSAGMGGSSPLDARRGSYSLRTRRRVVFEETPPLHSCIVGFNIGRFYIVEQPSRKQAVLCRVVFPVSEAPSAGWFALDLLTKAIDFFAEFFAFELPLKKIDLVALDCFRSLGMENWGMINLDMDYMLVRESTPLERRQRIARLVGHEVCHHWFGDWASIQWWTYIWLKEGMCRYLEYFFVDAVFPSWGIWNEFIGNIMDGALAADAVPERTHPIQFSRCEPRLIESSFDVISYGKGATLLRSLFSVISVEKLKKASHLLMRRFGNDSFNFEDLCQCIADAHSGSADDTQKKRMVSSVLKAAEVTGHPYVLVQRMATGYRVSQFTFPLPHRGILPLYVRHQRMTHGPSSIDLLTAPTNTSYEWSPERVLRPPPTPYKLPIVVLELRTNTFSSPTRLLFLEHDREDYVVDDGADPSSCGTANNSTNSNSTTSGTLPRVTGRCEDNEGHNESTPLPGKVAATRGGQECSSSSKGTTVVLPATSTSAAVLSPGSYSSVPSLWYFNYGGSGAFRLDYDLATWRRVFEVVPYLRDEDRMTITITLSRLRNVHIGHFPGEEGDRCTLLLEWLLTLAAMPNTMNAFLWHTVTERITTLAYMVQSYYCCNVFRDFVCSLYAPLHQRCLLSFAVREKTVAFQSQVHLTKSTVLSMLQLLAVCGSSIALDEAREVANWALASFFPGSDANSRVLSPLQPHGGGGGGKPERMEERMAKSASVPTLSGLGPSTSSGNLAGINSYGQLGGATPSHSSMDHGAHSVHHAPPVLGGDGGANNSSSGSGRRYQLSEAPIDFSDQLQAKAASVALWCLAEHGEMEYWAKAAVLLSRVCGEPIGPELNALHLEFPTHGLEGRSNAELTQAAVHAAPSFFLLENDIAFGFMTSILSCFQSLSQDTSLALFRNTRFLTYVLERRSLSPELLRSLINTGADYCSNGYIIALLKANFMKRTQGIVDSEMVEDYRALEFLEDSASDLLSKTSPTTAHPPKSSAGHAESQQRLRLLSTNPAIARAFDVMEANCVWMDYCCDHWQRFLRETRSKQAWTPMHSARDSHSVSTPIGDGPNVARGADDDDVEGGQNYAVGGVSI